MDEPNSNADIRSFCREVEPLADLVRHPAWKTYEEQILDRVICDLRDFILDSKQTDMGTVQGARFALKTLVKLRSRPHELLTVARSLRQEFGLLEAEESE